MNIADEMRLAKVVRELMQMASSGGADRDAVARILQRMSWEAHRFHCGYRDFNINLSSSRKAAEEWSVISDLLESFARQVELVSYDAKSFKSVGD